ncbi:FtsX-like permease family protein [Streptomyces sp. MUM 203J]|uniref:FtsX-like permease family protein n=1 Tax=Streptomyces sp. MUM 203J TaxID=2791990 RepID=UPI001F0500E7|nr:ABC transporter permease [Streptomyces sp. MUM 203J]MCH0540434.1 FtsX-like permease family protein [Streptomyces sp. MUM 203J]
MTNWLHSWRAAVRIARRDAWRFKGRSFLVLAMIALPILGVSAADLTLRSAQLSPQEKATRILGGADAQFHDPGMAGQPILQSPDGENYTLAHDPEDGEDWPDGATDVTKVVPSGATVLADTAGQARLRTAHGLLNADVREFEADAPMARGIMNLLDGRFPDRDDEVAVTSRFLEDSGLSVGSALAARDFDREYRIVGTYELPGDLKSIQVNFLPGAFLTPYEKALKAAGRSGGEPFTSYLVKLGNSDGFTWNMVKEANGRGVRVVSRAVLIDPPERSEVPLFQSDHWGMYEGSSSAEQAALMATATVVGLAMLEICLLAGPAFAVGARRSRRQLGLVGANGGDRRHIRSIVLAGGLVIGVAAAVVGTVLGVILTFALQPVLEGTIGRRFGSFDIRPLELFGIGLLAVLTGLLAAIVPAVNASRETVLASLTGRRGVRRSSRTLPVVGLIVALLGAAVALYGSVFSDEFVIVAGGSALAELGVVAMTPMLVGLFGRVGRWLPLSPRLALRDAVRNRGRTAPAVAAVLAAVAGTVAVATYAASADATDRAEYEAQLPYGAVAALVTEDSGRDVPTVRDAVQKHLPVDVRADVSAVTVGKPGCNPEGGGADRCGRVEVVVPKANECPLWDSPEAEEKFSVAERRELAQDWRCQPRRYQFVPTDEGLVVGDENLLKVLGVDEPNAAKTLAEGGVVSFWRSWIDEQDTVSLKLITDPEEADRAYDGDREPKGEVKSFPAYRVPDGETRSYGIAGIVSQDTAKATGMTVTPLGSYYTTHELPGAEQRQKLDEALAKTGVDIYLHVEEGYVSKSGIVLLALTVFAGLVTIGAAGIATGLAQADAEADLRTLAAVGAPTRVRRTLSGFQCGVVAAMGVLLGSAAGVLPAIGLRLTERRQAMGWYQEALDGGHTIFSDPPSVPIVVPWGTLGTLLVAVPLGAALLAALLTRSRGAVARRAET